MIWMAVGLRRNSEGHDFEFTEANNHSADDGRFIRKAQERRVVMNH